MQSTLLQFLAATAFSLICAAPLRAQQPASASPPPSIPDLLHTLHTHDLEYLRSLPNLYCDEHVISEIKPHHSAFEASKDTVDSVFRIRRPPNARTLADLKESRDIKTLDGKPWDDPLGLEQPIGLPLLILGVFSNGPSIFAPNLVQCLDVTLAPAPPDSPTLTLTFESKPAASRPSACPADRVASGSATIDRATGSLTHLERTITHYPIYPALLGTWTWRVDYAPTDLNGRTLVLPARIQSVSIADQGHAQLLFDATYTHYHRLAATSRILPAGPSPAEPAPPTSPSSRQPTSPPPAKPQP